MANRTRVEETDALESYELTPQELDGVAGGDIIEDPRHPLSANIVFVAITVVAATVAQILN